MTEITTRTEKGLHSMETPGGETEPKLTLSQLQSLLHAAADLERAQRPIVLSTSATPATAPLTAPAGAGVYVPMPPAAPAAQAPQQSRERNPWPLVFMVSGCTGLAAAATAAATGNQFAILAFFASVALWGTATYQLVFNREA